MHDNGTTRALLPPCSMHLQMAKPFQASCKRLPTHSTSMEPSARDKQGDLTILLRSNVCIFHIGVTGPKHHGSHTFKARRAITETHCSSLSPSSSELLGSTSPDLYVSKRAELVLAQAAESTRRGCMGPSQHVA